MSARDSAPGTLSRIRALLAHRGLYTVADGLDIEPPVGRKAVHQPYELLAYGALARLSRSAIRVQADLNDPATWAFVRAQMTASMKTLGVDLPPPAQTPPRWEHWRWFRDAHLATDEGTAQLARLFPPAATDCAHLVGLIDPKGPGSLTHPDRTRVAYGDGTIVRPLYNPPVAVRTRDEKGKVHIAYPDPRTGVLLDRPPGRFDPDIAEHHGQGGPTQGHGYVAFHTRGPHPYQRVVLAMDHIPAPGAEAATAVALIAGLRRAAGDGIQVITYDTAMLGVHVEEIMTRYGYIVVAKLPSDDPTGDTAGLNSVRRPDGRKARSYPLPPVTHTTPAGLSCTHQLVSINGQVVQIDLDESGDPVVTSVPVRGPVKRSRRSTGAYHFNVSYTLDCPPDDLTIWLSPHPGPDGDLRRPQNIRIIAPDDPDFLGLSTVRSDAENFHDNLKRTLLVGRQMSLGWRRGLVDLYSYALLNNAIAEQRALATQRELDSARGRAARRWQARSALSSPPA